MEFKTIRCPYCGNEGHLEKRDDLWYCSHCGNSCSDDGAERAYRRIEANLGSQIEGIVDEALRRQREEEYYNLRSLLWEKIHAKYIDSEAIVSVCRDIKKLEPHDFLASFFEVANSAPSPEVVDFINAIDVEEQEMFVEVVIDFMIRSLTSEYIMPVSYLIERAYKNKSLERFEALSTRFEEEAAKVDSGIYSTMLPRDVFIAYSSKDIERVMALLSELEKNGFSCFVALRNLQHGRGAVANYSTALHNAMNNSKMIVFVSSKNSRTFSCDALTEELAYVKEIELASAPAEYKNSYASLPDKYKKPRVEYRLDNEPTLAADSFIREFFADLDYCESVEKVVTRVAEYSLKLKLLGKRDGDVSNNAPHTEVAPLLKRVDMFLADKNWTSAAEYCERVLDIEPENVKAYLGKLLASCKVSKVSQLADCAEPFDNNPEYEKVMAFADDKLKAELSGYNEAIKARNQKKKTETAYARATKLMSSTSEKSLKTAAGVFASLGDYKDSRELAEKCREAAEVARKNAIYVSAEEGIKAKTVESLKKAIEGLSTIPDWRNSAELLAEAKALLAKANRKNAIITAVIAIVCIGLLIGSIILGTSGNRDTPDTDGSNNTVTNPDGDFGKEYTEGTLSFMKKSDGTYIMTGATLDSLTELVIPESVNGGSVTEIAESAFSGNKHLKSVVIPDSVRTIGNFAFYGCSELESVTFGKGVTKISSAAFRECKALTRVVLPSKLTTIADYAFYGTGLKEIYIPRSVSTVSDSAFWSCYDLERVYYDGTSAQWLNISFGIDNEPILVATRYYYSESAPTEAGNYWHFDKNGMPAVWDLSALATKGLTFELYDDGDGYFVKSYDGSATEVYIPETFNGLSVTGIAAGAFDYTDIVSVSIPVTVYYIGESAFDGCSALARVDFGSRISVIGASAFRGCESLKSIKLPPNITAIESCAFESCTSLEQIIVPVGVRAVADGAFGNCPQLKTVYFGGTYSDWSSIGIDNDGGENNSFINATRYFYTATKPEAAGRYWHYGTDGELAIWDVSHLITEGLAFGFDFDGYNINGYSGTSATVFIPSYNSNDLPFVKISDSAFDGNKIIETVILSENMKTIGAWAFYNCPNLRTVFIPRSIESVGEGAFAGTELEHVYYLGTEEEWAALALDEAFVGLPETTVYFYSAAEPMTDGNYWYYDEDGNALDWSAPIKLDGLTFVLSKGAYILTASDYYGSYAPKTELVIPSQINGKPVVAIGDMAFLETNLQSITVPDSVKRIGREAFANSSALRTLKLPSTIEYLGSEALDNSPGITFNSFGNAYYFGNDENPNLIFYKVKATTVSSVEILDGTRIIAPGAMAHCSNISDITVPDSVVSIGAGAFSESSLASIKLGSGILSVDDSAFFSCHSLTSIILPDSVESIGNQAFAYCSELESIYIGKNLGSIGYAQFYSSYNLNTIYYNGTVEDWSKIIIGRENTELSKITRYYYSEAAPTTPGTFWHYVDGEITEWKEYIPPTEGLVFKPSEDGMSYSVTDYNGTDTKVFIPSIYNGLPVTSIGNSAFYDCASLTSVTIPDSVTSIDSCAFQNCTNLTSVTIGNNVTSIGNYAFLGCAGITRVTIPDSVTSIGDYAFCGCNSLTSVTIPDSVTIIAEGAFWDCTSLTSVTISDGVTSITERAFSGCKSLTSVTIPDSITCIAYSAFKDCTSLTSVTIGNNVTSIGDSAFYGCTSLTSITYKGTVAQWNSISKDTQWIANTPVTEVVCSDGKVAI